LQVTVHPRVRANHTGCRLIGPGPGRSRCRSAHPTLATLLCPEPTGPDWARSPLGLGLNPARKPGPAARGGPGAGLRTKPPTQASSRRERLGVALSGEAADGPQSPNGKGIGFAGLDRSLLAGRDRSLQGSIDLYRAGEIGTARRSVSHVRSTTKRAGSPVPRGRPSRAPDL
jgi:hypothetical protein